MISHTDRNRGFLSISRRLECVRDADWGGPEAEKGRRSTERISTMLASTRGVRLVLLRSNAIEKLYSTFADENSPPVVPSLAQVPSQNRPRLPLNPRGPDREVKSHSNVHTPSYNAEGTTTIGEGGRDPCLFGRNCGK